eukprot:8623050-Alexandrium_andersonii.AAC.1
MVIRCGHTLNVARTASKLPGEAAQAKDRGDGWIDPGEVQGGTRGAVRVEPQEQLKDLTTQLPRVGRAYAEV